MAFGGSETGVLHALELPRVNDEARKARFERLLAENYAFVWRTARRLGVASADLEDVVQEVFFAAARSLDTIDQERGYLLRTCVFIAAHARRTLRRRREIIDGERLGEQVDTSARPDESAESSEARSRLQHVLNKLPEDLRTIFVLFELERLTMVEIATAMNLPLGTVASRLRRARKLFMGHAVRLRRTGGLR